ncbi:MAG: glycosyltransferase [Cyanobacteria bacterium J06598_3]
MTNARLKHTAPVRVNVLVLRGGGGHYTTYLALRAVLAKSRPDWQLTPIFADALGETSQNRAAGKISQVMGTGSDKFYDAILKNGFGWVHLITLHVHKLITRIRHRLDVSLLKECWQQAPPDLVLSVVPFHNRALAESIRAARLQAPVVSLLTDFADSPPAYWIEPSTENYLLCPTAKALEQAVTRGVKPDRAIQTSGLVVHPKFYDPQPENRALEREKLGLLPDRITGIVLFGANGSKAMLEVAKQLAPLADRLQLIFLCGRNQAVSEALKQLPSPQKRAVVDFTAEIPYYMHLADFFIGKPGNVSVSEALVMNLPIITERNWLTLPQERYAADWIEAHNVGLTIPTFKGIRSAVETIIEPKNFSCYRAQVTKKRNQAVFEVPQILEKTLEKALQKTS